MSTLPMYVISNGELAREALNAVVTLLGTDTFKAAVKISILFSIFTAGISYVRGHDIIVFAKWFIVYFALTTLMLGPTVNIQIIDSSNPGNASFTVGNVPLGLGYPASLITSVSHGMITVFEEAFSIPGDFWYNKTGMLFGSRLFRLSTEFNVIDPKVKTELNEYVKNCVLGDILINKKYSMSDLVESPDLFTTITGDTSNIRGIYINGEFKTCSQAKDSLKKDIEGDIEKNIFKIIGKKIFGSITRVINTLKPGEPKDNKAQDTGNNGKSDEKKNVDHNKEKLKAALQSVYGHFEYSNLSGSALQIATQNVLINAIRGGILNYTAEAGATAALLNFSTSQAMDRMRMTLATSRNIATYTIPVMHTVLLLLMLGLFPVIVFLAFQPGLTSQVLKNYLYTLLWIESWPLMFACLNLIVTYYTKSQTGYTSLTISNIDQLALEHSDIANMAGYLMLSIPFISGGLVKGMSSAFNHAASYIGGVLQSSASSAASESATGNIHLGNSSWNNVNANKFDTNATMMRGMTTEQLGTGVLRTSRPDGDPIYDASHALSKLPTSVKTSDLLSSSLSKQAEASNTASIQDQEAHDRSLSNSVSDFSSLGKTLSSSKNIGETFNTREAVTAANSVSDMQNIAKVVAKRSGVTVEDALKGLVNFSQGASFNIGGSVSGKIPGVNIAEGKIGLDGKIGIEHAKISESNTRYGTTKSIDVTAEEAKRFSSDLSKVEEYSRTQHADASKSTASSQLSQLSTDLRTSRSSLQQHAIHKADAERLSNASSYVKQHAGQIDSDLSQEVANYIVKRVGREEAEALFAGKDRVKFENLAREYISVSGVESSIISQYQRDSAGIDPNQKYQSGQVDLAAKTKGINTVHEKTKGQIDADAKVEKVGVDEEQYDQLKDQVGDKNKKFKEEIKNSKSAQNSRYDEMENNVAKGIEDGKKKI